MLTFWVSHAEDSLTNYYHEVTFVGHSYPEHSHVHISNVGHDWPWSTQKDKDSASLEIKFPWNTDDGRNPAPPEMYETLLIGIHYLSTGAWFLPSTVPRVLLGLWWLCFKTKTTRTWIPTKHSTMNFFGTKPTNQLSKQTNQPIIQTNKQTNQSQPAT